MNPLLDLRHPWFRPLWRRILVVAACLGWSGFEVWGGAPFWAILFGAVGVYAAWIFFFAWEDPPENGGKP